MWATRLLLHGDEGHNETELGDMTEWQAGAPLVAEVAS